MKKYLLILIGSIAFSYIYSMFVEGEIPEFLPMLKFALFVFLFFGIGTYIDSKSPQKNISKFEEKNNNSNYYSSQKKYQAGDTVNSYVAGVTFENHQDVIKLLSIGDPVYLIAEPNNQYDKYAIKVTDDRYSMRKIGYIPKVLTEEIGVYFHSLNNLGNVSTGRITKIRNAYTDHIGIEIVFVIPTNNV